MPLIATLIQKGQLEKRPNVGAIAGKRDEEGNIGGIVLRALPIRVEINRPIVTTHRENIRSYVLPDPDSLGERVPGDLELVGASHRLGYRRRRGRRRIGRGRWVGGTGGRWPRGFSENLTHARATVSGSGSMGEIEVSEVGFDERI